MPRETWLHANATPSTSLQHRISAGVVVFAGVWMAGLGSTDYHLFPDGWKLDFWHRIGKRERERKSNSNI
jgi:hypothetical protein